MDPELADAQQRGLEERIIPLTRSQPGFVQGRWTRVADGVRHIAFVEFDSASNAAAFAAAVRDPAQAGARDAVGISNESLDVVEVVGAA